MAYIKHHFVLHNLILGSKWHTRRKLLTSAFHFKILEDCLPVFNRNASLLVKKLTEEAKKAQVFGLDPFIALCTLDVICGKIQFFTSIKSTL